MRNKLVKDYLTESFPGDSPFLLHFAFCYLHFEFISNRTNL